MDSIDTPLSPDAPAVADVPLAPKRLLRKADILAAPKLPLDEVPVPEWGEGAVVTVQAMSGHDRAALEAAVAVYQECLRAAATGKDFADKPVADGAVPLRRAPNLHALVAQRGMVDAETRAPLFSAAEVAVLEQLHAGPLARIYDVVMRLSATTAADKAALERFTRAPTADGTTSSPK